MQPKTLNPIEVAIALAGMIFSPELSQIIGPYAVIVIAAATGSAWALGRKPPATRLIALWFFIRMNATAILLTVTMASLLHLWAPKWVGIDNTEWLLAPIALIVGGIGDDWTKIGSWFVGRLGRLFDRKYGTQDEPK